MEKRPSVVIVGGGIGGLFAANALIAHGLAVSVYEQAPSLGEVGWKDQISSLQIKAGVWDFFGGQGDIAGFERAAGLDLR